LTLDLSEAYFFDPMTGEAVASSPRPWRPPPLDPGPEAGGHFGPAGGGIAFLP